MSMPMPMPMPMDAQVTKDLVLFRNKGDNSAYAFVEVSFNGQQFSSSQYRFAYYEKPEVKPLQQY